LFGDPPAEDHRQLVGRPSSDWRQQSVARLIERCATAKDQVSQFPLEKNN